MKLITLLENRTKSKKLKNKHGLSLYIEVNGVKLIFDTGPDDSFLRNAKKLGVNVSDVDFLIISHGHIDHGGGIKEFIEVNDKARIIMSKYAFDKHYTKVFNMFKVNVGLNPKLKKSKRIELIEGIVNLNNGLLLFDGVVSKKLIPKSNRKLLVKSNDRFVQDKFKHEINLLLLELGKTILICGCAHKGIVNIIEKAASLTERNINIVVGGMHLYNPITKRYESDDFIRELGKSLSKNRVSNYYTGHCTGEKAYQILKKELNSKIGDLKTGTIIEI